MTSDVTSSIVDSPDSSSDRESDEPKVLENPLQTDGDNIEYTITASKAVPSETSSSQSD